MFLSEKDGGALVIDSKNDISTDSGVQSIAYNYLLGGSSPLDSVLGKTKGDDFEESLNAKITVQNMNLIREKGENQLQPMIDEKIVKSLSIRVVNTSISRLEIFIDFILLSDSPYSTKILTIDDGVIV